MSTFDPENFSFMEVQGSNSTQRTPVPEGEYMAVVKEVVKPTQVNTQEGPRWVCGLTYLVDSDAAREVTGLKEPTIRYQIWLDLSPQGGLDMGKGKNVDLGRAREAHGLNDPSKPFRMDQFVGRQAKITVKHRVNKDNGDVFAEVKKIAPLG